MEVANNKNKPYMPEVERNDGEIPKDYKNSYYMAEEKFINSTLSRNIKIEDMESTSIYRQMRRISFELSNMCVYSYIHKRCPTAWEKQKVILSAKVVYKVIDELSRIDYRGVIAFHIDNEPMIDPRLFKFLDYAAEKCTNAKTHILTNGFYLNQIMIDELYEAKLWLLMASAYSMEEYKRLCSLNAEFPYRVFFSILDSRKHMYNREPVNSTKSCFALLNDISVSCTGDLTLCCLDWKHMHSFGNLYEESLEQIMNKETFTKAYIDLAKGKRKLHLCQRCDWQR
ncbi:SPASM domain-containing protein [Ruminiclostridium josui]|uniref:SPASM domain-containing protein n=1 Tax=Ruminiclostridium josui TaxID=1499 RepID=UPI0004651111|nr:SPASM domain-containing protein [Ruminiclostridium josui]